MSSRVTLVYQQLEVCAVHGQPYRTIKHGVSICPSDAPSNQLMREADVLASVLLRRGWTLAIPSGPRDYADAAVAVLTATGQLQPIYELVGVRGFTLAEFAAEITRQTGKRVEYSDLTPAEYRIALVKSGVPGDVADLLIDFDLAAARGDLDGAPDDLQRLIGRSPTSLREAIGSALRVTAPAL